MRGFAACGRRRAWTLGRSRRRGDNHSRRTDSRPSVDTLDAPRAGQIIVAKVASDAEKPRGFVVLTAAAARERFADAPCGLIPGIGPKTAERLRGCGLDTLGRLRAAPPEMLAQRFGDPAGGGAAVPGALRGRQPGHAAAQGRLRMAGDDLRSRHHRPGPSSRRSSPDWSPACATRWPPSSGAGARSGSRSGWTTSPPTPAPGPWPNRSRPADRVGPIALELLRRFAAPRPVRLLGVRVAGLQPSGEDAAAQLTLAV